MVIEDVHTFFAVVPKNPGCNKYMYTFHSKKHNSSKTQTQHGTTFLALEKNPRCDKHVVYHNNICLLAEQSRPGTAAVARGAHKSTSSTSSDRLFGQRIQQRCANERSRRAPPQPDYGYLSVDAGSDLENQNSSAPSARLSWLRIIREDTQSSSSRAGLGCLVEKNTT